MTILDTLAERLMDSLDSLHGENARKAEYCIAQVLDENRRARANAENYNADYSSIQLTMTRLLEARA